MELRFEPLFLNDLLHAEAQVRGLGPRLQALLAAREEDGLDPLDAVTDAADSVGVLEDVREAVSAAVSPLADAELTQVELKAAHGGMPTLRRMDSDASLAIEPGPLAELLPVVEGLVEKFLLDSDPTAVTLPLGLGGSGGCACGDELPEDQPPGPLFAR